ncbi:LysR family transcriptional regulator [uncultured Sphingomonas sp.]|uniref:LysR family transcriptional regulator n=1 Tax=uncultured Sphingomonas sp. TaxID=158754 RepID=UPI0025D7FE57|nr:LysR family transcriptional regulator [uncultured Sphingomonas sp.]
MRREELVDLSAFMAVAEEQNFTKAAAKLGTSQSALSHTVRRLETRLGVKLLTRTTRSVAPTEAGERLLATLRPALGAIGDQLAAISELRDRPSGTIRITAGDHAARTVLWPVVAQLLPEYPEVHVEISVDGAFADIVAERFDAGVRLGEALAKDMIAVRISPELRMVVVASPAYLAHAGTPRTPQDLAQHRCINRRMLGSGGLYAWELEKDGHELRVRVEGQLTLNTSDLIRRAALAGLGLAFVMEDEIAGDLAAGTLQCVLEDWCPPFPGYHLYYTSKRQPSAAFSVFVNALRAQLRTLETSR